jgi:diguanylate cyclase (GGDEF)-like protein
MGRLRWPAGLRLVDREGRPLLELGRSSGSVDEAAARDPLTGLPALTALGTLLDRELARIRRGGHPGCLAVIGLDGFRLVNETLGHEGGDRVLVAVAELLTASSRTSDVVVRGAGDRFGLLLPRTGLGDAYRLAERHGAAIAEQLRSVAGGITASIGLAPITPTTSSSHSVHAQAVAALYSAKARRRGAIDVARRGLFEELRAEREVLVEAAHHDDRTGLFNSRRFASDLAATVQAATRTGRAYGLLLVDIDRFHDYNRAHGLLAGDEALRAVADALAEALDPAPVYRYGGEEFTAILAPPVTVAEVDAAGRRAVAAVRDLSIPHRGRGDGEGRLTVTAAGRLVDPTGEDAQAALRRVDTAMVRGKAAGRDRYIPASAPTSAPVPTPVGGPADPRAG